MSVVYKLRWVFLLIVVVFITGQGTNNAVIVAPDNNFTMPDQEVPAVPIELTPPFPRIGTVQVNRLPHPFNLNGRMPYQVWIDGQRLPLNSEVSMKILKAIDTEYTPPEDTVDIHNGNGWLFPLELQ